MSFSVHLVFELCSFNVRFALCHLVSNCVISVCHLVFVLCRIVGSFILCSARIVSFGVGSNCVIQCSVRIVSFSVRFELCI